MNLRGNKHLETLLAHYGERMTNSDGRSFDALVNADSCRGEFMPFKRLVLQHKGVEDGDGNFTYHGPVELMKLIFSEGNGRGNRSIFPGKCI